MCRVKTARIPPGVFITLYAAIHEKEGRNNRNDEEPGLKSEHEAFDDEPACIQ